MSKILCLSGGMDSVIAWYYLDKPPCVYFHTGVPYSDIEEMAIKELKIPCKIDYSLDFSMEKNIFIPHRNLLFASRASVYADEVVMGGLRDDNVEDKNEMAFTIMSNCLTFIGKKQVKITSPFWKLTKEDICKWFIENVPNAESILRLSVSCYSGLERKQCLACESCFRKACALYGSGIEMEFHNKELMSLYYYKAKNGYYDPNRNKSIIRYVEKT